MFNKINFEKNYDGTFNLLIYYSSTSDTEFGLEFLSPEKLKNNISNVLSYVRKNADKMKIDSVKIIVNGGIIATMALSTFMNVYGAESKYSMAYLYSGTPTQQISYIDRTNGALGTVSPSYFNINADGSLSINNISTELIDHAHSQGMKVIPFLSNHWDRNAGIIALSDTDGLSTQIANYISQYNLDGINVDIENVTEAQKDQYTDFVAKLRAKIPAGKEVSVAVAANPNNWLTGWHGSYDYTNLAINSDHLMIMAYDEHWQGSAAGPVSSISFVENSIKYALTKTTGDKIVIGLPFYGRIWSENNSFNGNGITLDKINDIITAYNATVTYDTASQSAKAVFTISSSDPVSTLSGKTLTPGTYTIWYENEASIQAKMSLISKYNLKGVGAWALGQEPSSIWQNYSSWLNQTYTTTPAPTVSGTGIVNATVLNVRSSPSANSQILTTLKKGTTVTILSTSNGWYTIRLANGQTAYVSSNYITLNTSSSTPSTNASTGIVNTAVLNVRNSPSTSSKVISTLKKGTSVTILSTANGWHNIRLANGQTAYVSASYINNTTATTNTTPTQTTTKTGIVNTAVLNVRSSPSTSSKVLTTLKRGTSVNIISTSNGWHTIKLASGQIAYVSSPLVSLSSTTSTTSTTRKGIVNTAVLNVRSGPSTSYKVLTTLRRGASVNIISTSNGWHTIKLTSGQTAYVSSSLIK